MDVNFPRIVIAALAGGLGKTTVALGLVGAWRRNGIQVVPFKKGPDYIDAAWLGRAAGCPCRNLDTYLTPEPMVLGQFAAQAGPDRVALVEGNRGLYDGMDEKGTFSTAELSKMLQAPVVLVVNCAKSTRTVAATVMGAQVFDPEVRIAGVILNNIAGSRHEGTIRRAIEERCGIPVLGAIPRLERPPLSDRHLGVVPPEEDPLARESLGWAIEAIERHVDWQRLLGIARAAPDLTLPDEEAATGESRSSFLIHDSSLARIGILRDAAFQFYYPENLEALRALGAEIVACSALEDSHLPPVDALYIGGGFPETCAGGLAANESFRRSVREAAEGGLPIYAECGGLMYLGRSLELAEGSFAMAGLFPFGFAMEARPVAHGYTALEVAEENPFYPAGTVLRGHEFHHSRLLDFGLPEGARLVLRMQRGQGLREKREGLLYKNTLALYTHVHALGTPQWAKGLVEMARAFRSGSRAG